MNNLIRDLGGMAGREEHTATAAGRTGDLVFTGSGKAGIVCDTADYAIGDSVAISTDALVEVDSASATTFAVGATANYDAANKLAVASGTAGTSAIGKVQRAKIANETSVLIRLNG